MTKLNESMKKQIVYNHIENGRTLSSLANEYNVSTAAISLWVRAYREECQSNPIEKSKLDLMNEIRELKKINAELEKEKDFLKKATAFFAKEID